MPASSRIDELRHESRRLMEAALHASDAHEKQRLAVRALELAQEAEQLERRAREGR